MSRNDLAKGKTILAGDIIVWDGSYDREADRQMDVRNKWDVWNAMWNVSHIKWLARNIIYSRKDELREIKYKWKKGKKKKNP